MSEIINKATLNYKSDSIDQSTISNVATVTLNGPVSVNKHSLEDSYIIGEELIFNIIVKNTSSSRIADLTITDDLGTYAINATTNVTPLTFVNPGKLYENQIYKGPITGTVSTEKDTVTFAIAALEPGHSFMIQYKALVNQYAGGIVGTSAISNIVSVDAETFVDPIIATNTIPVGKYAKVVVEKSMSPDPVTDGDQLTYNFKASNFGTAPATDAFLLDTFNPIPTGITVSVGGEVVPDDFTLDPVSGDFQYPKTDTVVPFTIASADFTQDENTGQVTIIPETVIIKVQGNI